VPEAAAIHCYCALDALSNHLQRHRQRGGIGAVLGEYAQHPPRLLAHAKIVVFITEDGRLERRAFRRERRTQLNQAVAEAFDAFPIEQPRQIVSDDRAGIRDGDAAEHAFDVLHELQHLHYG
jgi:hypothetical protein